MKTSSAVNPNFSFPSHVLCDFEEVLSFFLQLYLAQTFLCKSEMKHHISISWLVCKEVYDKRYYTK